MVTKITRRLVRDVETYEIMRLLMALGYGEDDDAESEPAGVSETQCQGVVGVCKLHHHRADTNSPRRNTQSLTSGSLEVSSAAFSCAS